MATTIIKGTLIQEIFNEPSTEFSTTASAHSANWQNYDLLIIQACQYDNVRESTVVTRDYFSTTSNGARPLVYDYEGSIKYEVWQNGNGSVNIISSKSQAMLRLKIFGIKFK